MNTIQHINDNNKAAHLLKDRMSHLDHEELWGIFLNGDCGLIAAEMLTMGSLTATVIDPRTVLRHALLNNAMQVIIAHNHPSTNSNPSHEDILQTRRVKSACDVVGISLVDHIILSDKDYYSFSAERTCSY